jgi:hypothetical protein
MYVKKYHPELNIALIVGEKSYIVCCGNQNLLVTSDLSTAESFYDSLIKNKNQEELLYD